MDKVALKARAIVAWGNAQGNRPKARAKCHQEDRIFYMSIQH